jgi:hypothetical protein
MASTALSTPAVDAGLGVRLESARGLLAVVVGEVDPDCLDGAGAAGLYAAFAALERLAVAGKTLVAPRIEASGVWREGGHANAATMLAEVEGVSPGQARHTLVVGHRLEELPGTRDVVRTGQLSAAKVFELTGAGILDPGREQDLLAGAEHQPLQAVRDRCHRSRATSGAKDPRATVRRIRAERHFSWWTDPEGAFCYQGRDTADRGAKILARLGPVVQALATAAKEADPEAPRQPERALRADAFFALVTRPSPAVGGGAGADVGAEVDDRSVDGPASPGPGGLQPARHDPGGGSLAGPDARTDPGLVPDDSDHRAGPAEPGHGRAGPAEADAPSLDALTLIDRAPPCSVSVRVDLAALLRGHAEEGEVCEIDNQGPIPVPMARDMADDSFLRFIFHRAGDIRAVSHFGRTIHRHLRTALVRRDTTCVVPGCGVSSGLEIDHILPFTEHGPTELDNLALLCHHHHFLKTYDGWQLARTGTDDHGGPTWRFEAQVPFGQEPGLGIDTPEARAEWRRRE